MGFAANPVRTWEAGRRVPTVLQVLHLARVVGVTPETSFAKFHPPTAPDALDHETLTQWMVAQQGGTSINQLAERSGLSRFAVSRALRGTTEIRLPQFLAVVHAMTDRVDDLIAAFVPIEEVPALEELHKWRKTQRELAFVEPWSEAITRLLETKPYQRRKHQEGWIAAKLGIPLEIEKRCVERMLAAGIVSWRDERLSLNKTATIYTGQRPEDVAKIKAHWMNVAKERMAAPREGDRFAYNIMSLSEEDYQKVQGILEDTYRQIRSVVAASKNEGVAALLQLHCMRW
jgi:transcriptional regulator with XRE-family HTH domain